MTPTERQPMLFEDLPIPEAVPATRAAIARRLRTAAVRRRAVQLALDFDVRDIGATTGEMLGPEDDGWDFMSRRRTLAGREPPPRTTGAASIFALAAGVRAEVARKGPKRASKKPAARVTVAGTPAPLIRVVRDGDRVRVVRLRPDETEEWAERERQRRARQRPPKPTKAAKSRGKKVRAWDGEGVED